MKYLAALFVFWLALAGVSLAATPTNTPTNTSVPGQYNGNTFTPVANPTSTNTPTFTNTPTPTPVPNTPTATPTNWTPTNTATRTPTSTPTNTATATPTVTVAPAMTSLAPIPTQPINSVGAIITTSGAQWFNTITGVNLATTYQGVNFTQLEALNFTDFNILISGFGDFEWYVTSVPCTTIWDVRAAHIIYYDQCSPAYGSGTPVPNPHPFNFSTDGSIAVNPGYASAFKNGGTPVPHAAISTKMTVYGGN